MEAQQGKLLGALYYDDSTRPFVAPPLTERKALTKERENDYILAKNTTNEIDRILRTLPKLEQSSAIYNELRDKVNAGLSGVNADNYADKLLDTQQLANDMMNKFGGSQLIDEAKQMSERLAEIDAAVASGKIVDPAKASWYKQQIANNYKGLQKDEQGYILNPNVQGVPVADYVDRQKLLLEVLDGWKADGTIIRDEQGRLKVGKDIPGYLSYGEKEYISEEELLQAGMKYLQNDEKVQAYLEDDARYATRNINPTAEYLNTILTPQQKEALTGNANATDVDLQLAISEGKFNPNEVVKAIYKQQDILNSSLVPAAKYGYTKEKLNTLSDTLLLEQFKALRAGGGGDMPDMDTASITIEPFTVDQVLNPANVKALGERQKDLVEKRKNQQIDLNAYQKAYNEKRSGYSLEELEKKNEALSKLDQEIAELEFQQKSVNTMMMDNAKKAGVNFDADYDTNVKQIEQFVYKNNVDVLLNEFNKGVLNNVKVEVTDLVKTDAANPYLSTYDGNIGYAQGLVKEGNKYYLDVRKANASGNNLLSSLATELVNPDGTFNPRVQFTDIKQKENLEATLSAVPSKEEYMNAITNAYIEDVPQMNTLSGKYNTYKVPGSKAIIDAKVLGDIQKVREKLGDFDFQVAQPLSYILVEGETTKSSLRAYVNSEKALNTSFRNTPNQYSIHHNGKLLDLATYLKEVYGIPGLDNEYIDWEKSNITTLLQSDRDYGQKHGINIVLTKDEVKKLNSKGEDVYNANSTIKLVGVNPNKNVPEENAEIRERVLLTYGSLANRDSEHSINIRQDLGRLYMDNSPEGKALDKLNLYTLPAGQMKSWDVKGTKYNILTTAKSGTESDLMNTNFHLTKIQNNEQYVLAVNKNQKEWKPLSEVEADSNWTKFTFETPADIKAVVGATLLDADYKQTNNSYGLNIQQQQQEYAQFLQANGYNVTNSGNQTVIQNYKPIISKVQGYYGSKPKVISLFNSVTGQTVSINSRVDASDLVDLTSEFKSRIANTSQFNYVNKQIVPYVAGIFNDFDVTMTGGFRGETTHFGLKESSNNSMHKYAHAVDFRADQAGLAFYDKVSSNPQLLKQYGIISILKHGDPLHVHVEFAPNVV